MSSFSDRIKTVMADENKIIGLRELSFGGYYCHVGIFLRAEGIGEKTEEYGCLSVHFHVIGKITDENGKPIRVSKFQ